MSDGSVFQLKDGRWRGVYQYEGKRKYVYGQTKAEAKRKMRDVQRRVEQGVAIGTPEQTVGQYMQSWLFGHVAQSCREKTIQSYTEMTRLHILPYIGNRRLSQLTVAHIQQMVVALQEKNLSQRSVQYAVGILSRALNHAVADEYIARNPATRVKVRVEKYEIVALTPEQARCFLKTVEGHRLYGLYRIALYMGLRQGELLALRWSDVDLAAGTLRIRAAKTEAGIRILPLSQEMVEVLQQHWNMLQEERKMSEWKEHGLVFPTSGGTPVGSRNLVRHFKSALKKAGLPEVRFHDLRHTAASLMYEAGIPEGVISKTLRK